MLIFRRILSGLLVFSFVSLVFESPYAFQEALSEEDPILFGAAITMNLILAALSLLSIRLGNQLDACKGFDIRNYILPQQVWVRYVAVAGAIFGIYSA